MAVLPKLLELFELVSCFLNEFVQPFTFLLVFFYQFYQLSGCMLDLKHQLNLQAFLIAPT